MSETRAAVREVGWEERAQPYLRRQTAAWVAEAAPAACTLSATAAGNDKLGCSERDSEGGDVGVAYMTAAKVLARVAVAFGLSRRPNAPPASSGVA